MTTSKPPRKPKAIPIYLRARIADIEEVDAAANEEGESRSRILSTIIRDWAKKRKQEQNR